MECDENVIEQLASHLNSSNNPAVDGHIFEWLFLAAVAKRKVNLYGDQGVDGTLPQARALSFDPRKRFKKWPKDSTTRYPGVISRCHANGKYDVVYAVDKTDTSIGSPDRIKLHGKEHKSKEMIFQAGDTVKVLPKRRFIQGDRTWLQPVARNQGGYDAVYFDVVAKKVIFVQVTRSNRQDFKMRFFDDVLGGLQRAGMEEPRVKIYFVVKPAQYYRFKIDNVEDHDLLALVDSRWTGPEDKHVKVLAFEQAPTVV